MTMQERLTLSDSTGTEYAMQGGDSETIDGKGTIEFRPGLPREATWLKLDEPRHRARGLTPVGGPVLTAARAWSRSTEGSGSVADQGGAVRTLLEASLPARSRGSATLSAMSESLRVTIVYEQGEEGWIVASIPEVPGAHSQGRTREDARANVIDALRGILELRFGGHGEVRAGADSEPLELVIGA